MPECPACGKPVAEVVPINLAGVTIAYPCGHEVVATRHDEDPPGAVRLIIPPERDTDD